LLIDAVKEAGVKTRQEMFVNYNSLLNCYKKIIDKLAIDEYSKIDDDIVLEASLNFDTERFSASFGDSFDRRRSSFKTVFGDAFSENDDFRFEPSECVNNLRHEF